MVKNRIIIASKLPIDEVVQRIEKGINQDPDFYTDRILTGEIKGTKIDATINPPSPISDPFKTSVNGNLITEDGETKLEFEVSFGILNKIILFVWYIPMFSFLRNNTRQDLDWILPILGILTIMSLLCFTLFWLKLKWDKERLEKWLIEILN